MFLDILKSTNPMRLSDAVAQQLELSIRSGHYPPGTRLPSHRQLAKEFGVSRPVLQKSMQLLQEQGLVVMRRGSGTYVIDPVAASRSALVWLQDNLSNLQQYYAFRRILEPATAALAASQATADELQSLKQNIDAAAAAVKKNDVPSFAVRDMEFHSLVAQMSHNPYLIRALNQDIHLITDFCQVIHLLPGHALIAHTRHVAIYEAIAAGDAQQASALMRDALVRVLQEIEAAA